jgi:hypothetical protein
MAFLALAADGRGASYYSRARIASTLGIADSRLDQALDRLLQLGLIDFRPWRPGHRDGVWQVLPVPADSSESSDRVAEAATEERHGTRANSQPETLADIVTRLRLPST